MRTDLQSVSSLILALVAVGGLVTSHALSKRGARTQEQQQAAATKLAEGMEYFDRLESINDRLTKEVDRLRADLDHIEDVGAKRLTAQAQRCRFQLESLVSSINALQAVVLSEVVKSSATDAVADAEHHLSTDHPEER